MVLRRTRYIKFQLLSFMVLIVRKIRSLDSPNSNFKKLLMETSEY